MLFFLSQIKETYIMHRRPGVVDGWGRNYESKTERTEVWESLPDPYELGNVIMLVLQKRKLRLRTIE